MISQSVFSHTFALCGILCLEAREGGTQQQGKGQITKYTYMSENTPERNLPLYGCFHQIWLLELQEMEELLSLIIFRKD